MKLERLLMWVAGLAVVLLTGCSTVGGALEGAGKAMKATGTTTTTSSHQKCDEQQEKGCVEFRALNFAWSDAQAKSGGLLHGLDKPYTTEAERERRAWELGNKLWLEGAREGRLAAGKQRSYMVYMYGLVKPDAGVMSAYQVNLDKTMQYGHRVQKAAFERVTAGTLPQFDPRFNLGQPDLVLRIRTDGDRPIGASVQLPWSMVDENRTHMLFCPEDEAVYPPVIAGANSKQGLWLLPSQLGHFKTKQSTHILMPFVFKDYRMPAPSEPKAKPSAKTKKVGDFLDASFTVDDSEE